MEAVLARGDRRVGSVILNAYKKGAIFDSWSEYFKFEYWEQAFNETGVSPESYVSEFNEEDLLAWDFIDIGITKKFLLKERHKAYNNECSGGCLSGCKGCGLQGRCDIK